MTRQEEYIEQYKILHKQREYGVSGSEFLKPIQELVTTEGINSVLDYGCGKSTLLDKLQVKDKAWYDPAVEGKDVLPKGKFDLVVNTDVLEHIPEEAISSVLKEIKSKLNKDGKAYFAIALGLAYATLPNGENAHCTVKPVEWWEEELLKVFSTVKNVGQNNRVVMFITSRQ